MHYQNFKTVVYIPAQVAAKFSKEKLEKDYAFLEKYIGLDKVYLETHRGDTDVEKDQLLMIKEYLEAQGVEVSGGITTVIPDFEGAEAGKQRLFGTFCYTDPAMRGRLKEISEFAAGLFDEVILDDFYFTNCTCERCIKEKGDRDWEEFRHALMKEVSEELVVKPAKTVNPKIKMVVKYPNWRESYHFTGYLPDAQQEIFDATYIGTETRSPKYADQHLPEYLSYALVRYLDNAWPGRNGGGWYDTYQCWSADRYMEQAYLTAFAKAKEMMFFQWSDLIENYFVGGIGIQFRKLDATMRDVGAPTGISAYIPYASCGENHLEMRLGMLGIPMDPTPEFPTDGRVVVLTESAAADKDVVKKLQSHVAAGGQALVTTGFLKAAGEELRREGLTEARVTERKLSVTRYQITDDPAGYLDDVSPIVFPEIVHGNNASWSLVNGGDGDYHTPLLLSSTYGKGKIYILSIPDNPADLYRIPCRVTDALKRVLSREGFVSGKDFSVFTYDDGSMILYRYVKGDIRPAHVKVYTKKNVRALKDTVSGETFIPSFVTLREGWESESYLVADVILQPGIFRKLKWEN